MTAATAGLARLLREEAGLEFSPAQERALRAAVERAAPGLGPEEYLRALGDPARAGELLGRLIDEVTVQETAFARDREQLAAIAWRGLHESALAGGSGTIRVWSAGCATGEEPYTLALLAAEVFAPAQPPLEVLGTDISQAALRAAAAGRYRPKALRKLGSAIRRRYFELQDDGTYLVGAQLRKVVRFQRHNLIRDACPPPGEARFDLVVCRNVLIYFAPALAERVIGSLERSVRPGGTLLLGAADALPRSAGPPPARAAGPTRHDQPTRHDRPARQAPPAVPGRANTLGRPADEPPAQPLEPRQERLAAALAAADRGDATQAALLADALLADDPLDADAHFVRGLVALDAEEPALAAAALRRALYADPSFALAAFALGRAYDALGDGAAARRSYRQALGLLNPEDHRHELMLQQIDIGDIAAACRTRLGG